jgi:hypothetical protein
MQRFLFSIFILITICSSGQSRLSHNQSVSRMIQAAQKADVKALPSAPGNPAPSVGPKFLTPKFIAKAFEYPGILKSSKVTNLKQFGSSAIPLWSLSFSDDVGTFAPVQITAFQGETFLNKEMEAQILEASSKYKAAIEKAIEKEGTRISRITEGHKRAEEMKGLYALKNQLLSRPPVRVIDAPWETRAYVQVTGIGPGGGGIGFIARSPDKTRDIFIEMQTGSETRVPRDSPETHDYFMKIQGDPWKIVDLVARAGNRIVSALLKE